MNKLKNIPSNTKIFDISNIGSFVDVHKIEQKFKDNKKKPLMNKIYLQLLLFLLI